MKNLLNYAQLENSPTVANSLMNRERVLRGGNSYEKELSFDIFDFLKRRAETAQNAMWLDLCCGSGNALIEAAGLFARENLHSKIEIFGIDLAGMFAKGAAQFEFLHLIESSFENWFPANDYDLITCVHGIHYVGDKIALIEKAAAYLKNNGIFLANLDPLNLMFLDAKRGGQTIIKKLRASGFEYHSGKHLLICKGKKEINLNYKYLGADDRAGVNYTKQPAVNSYYERNSLPTGKRKLDNIFFHTNK